MRRIIVIFVGLCAAAGLLAAFEWRSSPSLPAKEIRAAAEVREAKLAPPEPVSSAKTDADRALPAMEAWWKYRTAMEAWWKFHQTQAQRPAPGRRVAAAEASPRTIAELAEQSWGVEDVGYEPPRYLSDTTRWPIHGPAGGKQ